MRAMVPALILVAMSASGAMAQQGGEGAERFVREVYATYSPDGDGAMGEAALTRFWSPQTAALIRRDRELAVEEPPYLDADPICQCQDWENLTVQAVEISQFPDTTGPIRRADVWFLNGGEQHQITLRLRGNPSRWRIEDVLKVSDHGGLVETLQASNASLEAGGRAADRD